MEVCIWLLGPKEVERNGKLGFLCVSEDHVTLLKGTLVNQRTVTRIEIDNSCMGLK